MDESMKRFKATYPSIQFRGVGCDLSQPGFIEAVKGSTSDIHISLVFNNAGYIMPGFFVDHGIDSLMANYNVNATCNLPLTHHFAQRMVQSGRKGLICFTSSSGGFIPGPMSSIYSSTKAFVTNFAVSIAAELAEDGIDVLCVHPSPIASNFYQNAGQMSALKSVQKAAQPPSVIADIVFKNAGRFTIVDQGLVSVLFKSILKIVDWNLLGEIMVKMVRTNGDYKAFRKARKNK
jgi:short-subunit dehydrogenase